MSALTKRLAELAGLGAVLVVIVLWITSALEGKASTARAAALEDQQHKVEVMAARMDERLKYVTDAVTAIAARVGAIVPPAPNP